MYLLHQFREFLTSLKVFLRGVPLGWRVPLASCVLQYAHPTIMYWVHWWTVEYLSDCCSLNSYNIHLCPSYTKYDYKHIFSFHSLKKQGKYNLLLVLSLNHPKHWYHVTVRPILLIAPITAHSSHYNDEFVGTQNTSLSKTKSHQQYDRKRESDERERATVAIWFQFTQKYTTSY